MKHDFLLEIGCEEIPARMLPSAEQQLRQLVEDMLRGRGVLPAGQALKSWSTPRRLAVYGKSLLPAEPDREEQLTGPPWSAAFDSEGNPTKAASGFAAKCGVPVAKLKKLTTEKGEYVGVVRRQRGAATGRLLAKVLPGLIEEIRFPRTMYWTNPQGFQFIRPVRWIVALYDGRVLPFSLGGVTAGNTSFGHRKLYNKPVVIRDASRYESLLARCGVIASPDQRRELIEKEIAQALRKRKLRLRPDPELLEILVNMTEHPSVLLGDFPKAFLELPVEVLTTVMRHHQKYLSVETSSRKLAPHFIAVLDRDKDRTGKIRRGHETVLQARFRDAQFFWAADQRQALADRLADLDKVTFHSKLGSYGNKVRRIRFLVEWLTEQAEFECRRADNKKRNGRHADTNLERRRADIRAATRAAELCKSDLTTQLVGEFPELQGIVGGLYAEAQGETATVARAIYEHYLPLGPRDATPSTPEGAALSLADKLDTLAGCFAVGDVPSGSRDPFALRRAANGVVRIIHDSSIRISIAKTAQKAAAIHANLTTSTTEKASAGDLLLFLEERARYHFRETLGFAYDEVNAVFAAGWDDLIDLEIRLRAMHDIRPTENFAPLSAAFKRIRNILSQAGETGQASANSVVPKLLEDGPERGLWEHFRTLQTEVARLRGKKRYSEALRSISSLRPDVDLFFDKVLVNDKDPAVRRNRLALLSQILTEFSTIADFSQIVTE